MRRLLALRLCRLGLLLRLTRASSRPLFDEVGRDKCKPLHRLRRYRALHLPHERERGGAGRSSTVRTRRPLLCSEVLVEREGAQAVNKDIGPK